MFEQVEYNTTPEERLNVQIKGNLVFFDVGRVHDIFNVNHTNK
jgi:hypothetical protein